MAENQMPEYVPNCFGEIYTAPLSAEDKRKMDNGVNRIVPYMLGAYTLIGKVLITAGCNLEKLVDKIKRN